MARVSVREYARQRGVSHTAVQKAIKSGRLSSAVNAEGIDPAIADLEWVKSSRETGETVVTAAPKIAPAPKAKDREHQDLPPSQVEKVASTYAQSRAAKEAYSARLTRLDYEERSGKLIDAEDVKNAAYKAARQIRDMLLTIPDRISAELAAETDSFRVNERLTKEIRKVLEGLKFDDEKPNT